MDDCNLEKLTIKPGKLTPAFHKDVTEYNATVASNVEKITFDCMASDSGASYSISNSGGGKTVPLKEGDVNDFKIEVTAEDGTTKNYFAHIKRLSAKDASLSDVKLSTGTLDPEFSSENTEYYCSLPCSISSLTLTPTVPDPKIAVKINAEKTDTPIQLNVGATKAEIEATSVDGSNIKVYVIHFMKMPFPRYVKLTDADFAARYEDPVSLSPLYRPISIRGSDPKHTFSEPIMSELTRTSKFDPLNENPLDTDWKIIDYDLDKKITQAIAFIPLTYGGVSDSVKFAELGEKLQACNQKPKVEDVKDKYKNENIPMKHTLQVRSWEKQLHQVFDETNPTKLCKLAEEQLEKYYKSLPKPGESKNYSDGESPLDYLEQATFNYAVAVKNKGKDAELHLKLGLVLEEKYYAEDMLGLKKEGSDGPINLGDNLAARESSKQEECAAICKLHGVSGNTPLSLQLQAIDKEYHDLINAGQSGKADHVQALFAWKSKQATQEGAAAQKAADEESSLGQAYLKYLDALSLDDSKAVYNFHVGRMLVIQGNYEEAVKRLEQALCWNGQHQWAKYYLGLALALQKDGPGVRAIEAITYLQDGMESLLTLNTEAALNPDESSERKAVLQGDNVLRNDNVHLLRGINELAKLVSKTPNIKDTMSALDIYHTAALLAAFCLPDISRGDSYKQFEWVLLEAHTRLLELLSSNPKGNEKLIAQRCERLSALIRYSTIPQNEELLALQQKTCQTLVTLNPCSSQALYLLGAAQLSHFENNSSGDNSDQMLQDAQSSFEASIALEGKPACGSPPDQLKDQKWWQDKVKKEEEEKKAAEAKAAPSAVKTAAPARGGAAGGRGAPAARGSPAAKGRAPPARGAATATAKGTPAAKGARGGATKPVAPPAKAPVGKPAPVKSASGGKAAVAKSDKCTSHTAAQPPSPAKAEEAPNTESVSQPASASSGPVPINRKLYQTRLGLARVLAKNQETIQESAKYYNEVITMAPEVHDAYVEYADMMIKNDPLAAVDVYCKFPVSENPTFDDAYIFGEIVRLLMKAEKFNDPRLGPNMIAYGRVMGIGILEKHVQILDDKFKSDLLKSVYAGVNHKTVDDPDMQAFFKFKCWI